MTVANSSALRCDVCSAPAKVLRHSGKWGFDVAKCGTCGTVFVVDAPRFAFAGQTSLEDDVNTNRDWGGYVDAMRNDDETRLRVLDRIRAKLPRDLSKPMLFDVGAGAGDFLIMARDRGFDVTGNELSASAITFAAETRQIVLSDKMIDAQPERSVDAMTMWCVVAHVPDAHVFLADAFRMLRPGGVLFLRTPRWCAIDTAGTALAKLTRGKKAGLADRRVFPGHVRLYNARSIATQLREVGFADVDAIPTVHYSLTSDTLMAGVGAKGVLSKQTRLLDTMIERGWMPRNALMVYARRPLDS